MKLRDAVVLGVFAVAGLGCPPELTLEGTMCAPDGGCPVGLECVATLCLQPGSGDSGTISDGGGADAGGTVTDGGSDAGPAPDAGASDSGAPDAGAPDSGAPDAGALDAGGADASVDAGLPPWESCRKLGSDGGLVWRDVAVMPIVGAPFFAAEFSLPFSPGAVAVGDFVTGGGNEVLVWNGDGGCGELFRLRMPTTTQGVLESGGGASFPFVPTRLQAFELDGVAPEELLAYSAESNAASVVRGNSSLTMVPVASFSASGVVEVGVFDEGADGYDDLLTIVDAGTTLTLTAFINDGGSVRELYAPDLHWGTGIAGSWSLDGGGGSLVATLYEGPSGTPDQLQSYATSPLRVRTAGTTLSLASRAVRVVALAHQTYLVAQLSGAYKVAHVANGQFAIENVVFPGGYTAPASVVELAGSPGFSATPPRGSLFVVGASGAERWRVDVSGAPGTTTLADRFSTLPYASAAASRTQSGVPFGAATSASASKLLLVVSP